MSTALFVKALTVAVLMLSSFARSARCEEPGAEPTRKVRVDQALARAVEYFERQQSADGAWRSNVYAQFKEGDALTPLVMMAWDVAAPDRDLKAADAARQYLADLILDAGGQRKSLDGALAYSTYTAAGAVIVLSHGEESRWEKARNAWLAVLTKLQLTDALGWRKEDRQYGGWGYASAPPRRPEGDTPLAPLAEPNLSATVFAISALRIAGVDVDAPAIQRARVFVERCQNLSYDADTADQDFDDGGFFFVAEDDVRNKAGIAGVDRHGRRRFASYGSATADGTRALLLCGARSDEPRVAAALGWLIDNFSADAHPGNYVAAREGARGSLYFYYTRAAIMAIDDTVREVRIERPRCGWQTQIDWARALADALLARQRPDGSWINDAVDAREDDPLVATSLAAESLAACRRILAAAGE